MCGIYTLLTAPGGTQPVPDRAVREAAARLIAAPPEELRSDALRETMLGLRQAAFSFLKRAPQLAVVRDQALRSALARTAADLEGWVRRTEALLEHEPLNQEERESLNRLMVGARDTAWQLGRDVLPNAEKIALLLGEGEPRGPALDHAWQLNLILNNLDRLEVRGRDSAGIAAYLYFPSTEALELFLARPRIAGPFAARDPRATFGDTSACRPAGHEAALLFAFKVAEEVGELGQNVRELRSKIAADAVFQEALREEGTRLVALAHTRWASNGIISVPNCHPVDSATLTGGGRTEDRGLCIAALNGDIDNFQELKRQALGPDRSIDPAITTDAKIIPVLMAHLLRSGLSFADAFREMIRRFEGSFAIALLAAQRPGELFLAQRGSGQGLFLGFSGESIAVASEMYGIVELTDRYLKARGEREEGGAVAGECFHVRAAEGQVEAKILEEAGVRPVPEGRVHRAEITTRDIDRGSYPRYLLKEITESVDSVRKTCRGKVEIRGAHSSVRVGDDAITPSVVARLKDGRIRRIIAIGQGTAAVAAAGIAALLERALAPARLSVSALKATELSGHFLRPDMSDALVIAVSQSGTTTDTNRTVDLVRSRGAAVIGIVNRRNSDLVYKADAVLYTSDGRDIEMSVASTKAFYAQNVAGQLLALSLAHHLGTLAPPDLAREIEALARLPAAMERTLTLSPAIEAAARAFAPRRSYWAIVGTGPGKIAADEIRIKLSELCYKAIAVDFLEDKKHIDLSSEPLIIVCAAGLAESQTGDAVKEVAIFKAHNAIPIVIAEEGEERFAPYAAATLAVPRFDGSLAYLLSTMVGHLFGYHAAATFEGLAHRLRRLRREVVRAALAAGGDAAAISPDPALVAEALEIQDLLAGGAFDSALGARAAVRLSDILDFLLGRFGLDLLPIKFRCPGTATNCLSVAEEALSRAIDEVSRPIDAIKHQAKTVTVGISRTEEVSYQGPIWQLILDLRLPKERVATSAAAFLGAFGKVIAAIDGHTLYELANLSPLGQPTGQTILRAVARRGCAGSIPSRYDEGRPLVGTKLQVVIDRKPYAGLGQKDERRILMIPFTGAEEKGHLLLVHLTLREDGPLATRIEALAADRERYNRLVALVTERDIPWSDDLIQLVDNDTLFLRSPEEAGTAILAARAALRARG